MQQNTLGKEIRIVAVLLLLLFVVLALGATATQFIYIDF